MESLRAAGEIATMFPALLGSIRPPFLLLPISRASWGWCWGWAWGHGAGKGGCARGPQHIRVLGLQVREQGIDVLLLYRRLDGVVCRHTLGDDGKALDSFHKQFKVLVVCFALARSR